MPDYPTNAPAAGWYTDPSNPAQERWWGGVEWTHDVRPLAAAIPPSLPAPTLAPALAPVLDPTPVPAPAPVSLTAPVLTVQPVLANVPGGGINPFAAIDAQEAQRGVDPFADSFSAPASGFSSYSAFGTGTATSTVPPDRTAFAATPAWYGSTPGASQRPDPTNGQATAGLILSLVGLNVLGIVFSILGLRKARDFEADGDLPVGRKRSRWGLGLGIASLVITLAIVAAYLFAFQYFYNLYLEQVGSSVVQTEQPGDDLVDTETDVTPPVANDGTYVRSDYEQAIRDEYAEDGYPAPDTVTCPDTGSTAEGGVIVCEIVTGDLVETRTAQYYADGGYDITTTSMSG